MPELGEPVHPILEEFEPFERRQVESPPDQSEIDTIRRLLRRDVIRCRLGVNRRRLGRLGHGDHYSKGRVETFSRIVIPGLARGPSIAPGTASVSPAPIPRDHGVWQWARQPRTPTSPPAVLQEGRAFGPLS